MFSSNCNNKNKTDISIEVGCTGSTSGPCNLTFHRQSPNSPSKVECANDANCTNPMNTYYYCNEHESHMCCNCAYREQQKEKQEKQKTNKYDHDNDVYMPEDGEIIEQGDNEYKYDGPNSHSTITKNKGNKKRKLSSLQSADKYESPCKKRKLNFDLEDYANLTGNDVIEMVNEKQNEINKLNLHIRQQKRCTEKLEKQLKEKDEMFDELKQDKNKLAKQLNDYINDIAEKNHKIKNLQIELNTITAKNNRMKICNDELSASNADLNSYKIKSIQDISNLRDTIAAYEKQFETYKRVMDENDTLKQDNKNLRKQLMNKDKDLKTSEWKNSQFEKQRMDLKHARDNCTFQQYQEFNNALNKFLDRSN